jgi:uncharacterized membrane protein
MSTVSSSSVARVAIGDARKNMPARGFSGQRPILALAAAGLVVSVLLEVIHYRAYVASGADDFCTLGGRLDCTSVALSKYSFVLGVPLPVWGVAEFFTLGFVAWRGSRWLVLLAGAAALAGVVLTGVSAWGVGAWCLMCELAHVLAVAIFAYAWRARNALARTASVRELMLEAAPALGVLLAARLSLPHYWGVVTYDGVLPFAQGTTEEGDPWIGAEHPKLILQEFVDYTCPHCKAASARSLQRVAAHPGELRIVRRHWPRIPCQPHGETRCLPLRIALCAQEQGRFWQADRWLYDHSLGVDVPDVGAAARTLGLDGERLAACVTSVQTRERAVAEWNRARKMRLPGAPYYAHGEQLVTAATASALIDAL